jgi:hypothetical protein
MSEIGEIDEYQNNEKSESLSNGMNDYYENSGCWNNGKDECQNNEKSESVNYVNNVFQNNAKSEFLNS